MVFTNLDLTLGTIRFILQGSADGIQYPVKVLFCLELVIPSTVIEKTTPTNANPKYPVV